jgi:hypothetical protein
VAVSGSFRDPSGFVFTRDGILYRQVNDVFQDNFDLFLSSGLYDELVGANLLIPHEDADTSVAPAAGAIRVIRPEVVPFISYPYEWSFSQLKDAALATLEIQRRAMDRGMSLRDATAYNIQFRGGKPILIDSLSFERLREGEPWVAYRQFCQHFLAPLALASYTDARLPQLARVHLDGIPLDLAAELLPGAARRRMSLLVHLFGHARSQVRHERAGATGAAARPRRGFSLQAFRGLIDSLEKAVSKLAWRPARSAWAGYYAEADSYRPEALDRKKAITEAFVRETAPAMVWDLGANTGLFSRIAAGTGAFAVSFDLDPAAVEENYRTVVAQRETNVLPLVMDLANPSPAIGWENAERRSLLDRGPADIALALALIHHLAIGNNVPLDRLASFFARVAPRLAIEFVPKSDPKVQVLLATREDVFPNYTQAGFEEAFGASFATERREPIQGSDRVLYLMRAR